MTIRAELPYSSARITHPPSVLAPFERFVRHWGLRQISAAGLLGTLFIAIGSYGAGALPANDPTRRIPVLGLLRHGSAGLHVALGLYYIGLLLFVIAWLVLGRVLLTGSSEGSTEVTGEVVPARRLGRMVLGWMLPLLAAMPLASSDLYSYAAQAQLAKHGFNPYTSTPADLPGKFLDNVAWKWVDTPSPYGPAWVAVSKWAAALTGDHALISVLLLRLLPFASIVVIARLLPHLARRFGVRADLALWLVVANPLMLVHGVGGGHNDVVMVVLMLGAISLATRPGAGVWELTGAAALATLSAAIKAPGIVVVAFIVPIYFLSRGRVRMRDWVRACLLVAAVAVVVFAVASLIAGVGLGWTKQVNSSVPVFNFMSIPTSAAVLYRVALGVPHAGTIVDQTVRNFRTAGTVLSGIALVLLWLRATRSAAVGLLTAGLVAIVVLGPAVQPWYFLWALGCVVLLPIKPTQVSWIAAASVALTLLTRPMGSSLESAPYVPAVIAAALASRALLGPVVHRHTA